MKRLQYAALAALVLSLSLLASCALFAPEGGNLSFTIPDYVLAAPSNGSSGDAASRAVFTSTENLKFVRVFLEVSGALQPLGTSGVVFETSIPANKTIEINDVPPMRDCTIYLALSENGVGDFRAVKYAKSAAKFNVVAGSTSEVIVDTYQSPFQDIAKDASGAYLRDSNNGVKALEFNGKLYFLAGGKLYYTSRLGTIAYVQVTGGNNGITQAISLSKGKVLTGGAFGDDRIWINTDKGIWAFNEPEGIISQVTAHSAANNGTILDSGAITVAYTENGKTATMDAIYYQRKGGAGGAYKEGTAWKWVDSNDYLDALGTFKDTIQKSTSKIVSDMHIENNANGQANYGYVVVPGINTIRVGAEIKENMSTFTEKTPITDIINAFTKDNTVNISDTDFIRSLSKASDKLYVGTSRGVYYIGGLNAAAGSEGKLPAGYAKTAIALSKTGTKLVDVVKIRAKSVGSDIWVAVLGKRGSVYIIKNDILIDEYQFYTGIPEFGGAAATTGDIFWSKDGFVITGTNGAVLYPVASPAL